MPRSTFLANRLRELFLNGRWIANTNYREQLAGIPWQTAVQKTGGLNTIAALTFHIDYYLKGLLHAFGHGRLEISDKYSFDAPGIGSAEGWETLTAELLDHAERFAALVEGLDDSRFDEPFIDEKFGTVWRNIEGVIEHSYYHLGQIVLMGKLSESR